MSLFGKELRMYDEIGLKSAPAWFALGRKVEEGSVPRASVDSRGQVIQLFSKDQTGRRERTRQPQ